MVRCEREIKKCEQQQFTLVALVCWFLIFLHSKLILCYTLRPTVEDPCGVPLLPLILRAYFWTPWALVFSTFVRYRQWLPCMYKRKSTSQATSKCAHSGRSVCPLWTLTLPTGLLLGCVWAAAELRLSCVWVASGLRLGCVWAVSGLLRLGCV